LVKKIGEEMKFAGWYSTIVGVLNLGMWAIFLATGQVPELQTAPLEISFHLTAELGMALVLIVGGVAILTNRSWGKFIFLIALGMLLYSVVNSSGYFAQLSQWQFVGIFAVLLVFALVSLIKVARFRQV